MSQSSQQIFSNARVVLANEVRRASVVVREGRIVAIDGATTADPTAIDCQGDYLLPGLVELHTDNLERHVQPRPRACFPMQAAVQAHDAEVAAAGITTVFDAIGLGDPYSDGFRSRDQSELLAVLDRLEAHGVLRADHYLHVRCELPAANARALFEPLADHRRLRLMSLMDHTPGQRQWADLERARAYYIGKKGWSDARFDQEVRLAPQRGITYVEPHRQWFATFARDRGITLATHDDATIAHVEEARASGSSICEFPTTIEAARHAHQLGMQTIAGAPNIVRGGSHAGNVASIDLARAGLLDMLSSDYVPGSLLYAAWILRREAGMSLPQAVAVVSRQPALACGMTDRGEIAIGQRADLLRVDEVADTPVVRQVFARGVRVA